MSWCPDAQAAIRQYLQVTGWQTLLNWFANELERVRQIQSPASVVATQFEQAGIAWWNVLVEVEPVGWWQRQGGGQSSVSTCSRRMRSASSTSE